VEHKFPTGLLFCCHLHGLLEEQTRALVEESDVIHCQSSGYFPVLAHMQRNQVRKPLVMESPVLASHTGTLYAATNRAKHYKDVPQNSAINWALDTFAFTPQWTADTLARLVVAMEKGDALVLHSDEDGVSDCRGLEQYLSHVWPHGKHARLFHPEAGNDFQVVEQYLRDYRE